MEFFVLWLHVHMHIPRAEQIIHGIAKMYVTGYPCRSLWAGFGLKPRANCALRRQPKRSLSLLSQEV